MKRLIVTLAMLITVIALNAQNAARIAENLKNDIRIFATAEVVQSSDDLFIANLVSDCTESEGVEVITNQVLSYNRCRAYRRAVNWGRSPTFCRTNSRK